MNATHATRRAAAVQKLDKYVDNMVNHHDKSAKVALVCCNRNSWPADSGATGRNLLASACHAWYSNSANHMLASRTVILGRAQSRGTFELVSVLCGNNNTASSSVPLVAYIVQVLSIVAVVADRQRLKGSLPFVNAPLHAPRQAVAGCVMLNLCSNKSLNATPQLMPQFAQRGKFEENTGQLLVCNVRASINIDQSTCDEKLISLMIFGCFDCCTLDCIAAQLKQLGYQCSSTTCETAVSRHMFV